jgi:SAM-dependent methyltransferase
MTDRRARARELAAEYIGKGKPLDWFEVLYQEGEAGKSIVPWADSRPNPQLVEFWNAHLLQTAGKSALVIAGGLGDDAEQLAAWGFRTTSFDIAPTAIEIARRRFPATPVSYVVADLFHPPADWARKFEFIFETNTLQALPPELRPPAIEKIASFLKPGGNLLVVARGREENEPKGDLPWPLTKSELAGFERQGLEVDSFDDFSDPEPPWVRRFRIFYKKPKAGRGQNRSKADKRAKNGTKWSLNDP